MQQIFFFKYLKVKFVKQFYYSNLKLEKRAVTMPYLYNREDSIAKSRQKSISYYRLFSYYVCGLLSIGFFVK